MRLSSSPVPWLFVIAGTAMCLFGCSGAAPAGAPAATAAPARPAAGDVSDGGNGFTDPNDSDPVPAPQDGALVIYTGSMTVRVTDLRTSIEQATALVSSLGGHVAASHEEHSGEYADATVTYRIPAARWNEALAGLRSIGEVLSEDTDSEDVTAQVIDLDARIANLRASESALQAIMSQATTIPDVLKVQEELGSVRGEIESMTAQRDHLADQAALATLQVSFAVPVAEAAVATGGWDLGREIDAAVATLVRVGQGAASLGVWVAIVLVPVLIPVLLAGYAAVRIRRWYLARSAQQPSSPAT